MIRRLNPAQSYGVLLLCVCVAAVVNAVAADAGTEGRVLWRIGKVDNDTAELAVGRVVDWARGLYIVDCGL